MEHTLDSVTKTIKTIVAETLKVNSDDFSLDTPLRDELGADSLDAISIAMDVDEAFGIQVDDAELNQFSNCAAIISAVLRHLNLDAVVQRKATAKT